MRKFKFLDIVNDEDEPSVRIDGEIMPDADREVYEKFFGLENQGTSPNQFAEELSKFGGKDISVYINSVGGDVFAASQMYQAIKDYKGNVTVKIDGLAASAASFIAMAGDRILMSSTAEMMIHNPATAAQGDHNEMEKAAEVLGKIKESIISAYAEKTGKSEKELSDMMENETWLTAEDAIKSKFADGLMDDVKVSDSMLKHYIDFHRAVYNCAFPKDAVEKAHEETPHEARADDKWEKEEFEFLKRI